jgi:hypothetical protein
VEFPSPRALDLDARIGEIDVGWANGLMVFGGPVFTPFRHID